MTDDSGHWSRMMWAYKATFTQTDAGGGTVKVTITFNERTELLFGMITAGNHAAGRSTTAYIQDAAGTTLAYLVFATSLDDQQLPILVPLAAAAETAATTTPFYNSMIIGATDVLIVTMASLAQNETMNIALRGLITSTLPSVVTTGSGGTVTTTTAYNKVI